MNLGEIKTAVKRQFGDESGAQITEADITRWANDALRDIVRKVEITNQHRETAAVGGDGTYELPSNFMYIARVTYNSRLLKETKLQDLDLQSNGVDSVGTGEPGSYYIWNSVLHLHPAPASSGTGNLDIWYVSQPTALSTDADVPEIPAYMHEDIVRYCLARAKELDEDWAASQALSNDYEARIMQARYEQSAQPTDSYPSIRTLPGDDGGYY